MSFIGNNEKLLNHHIRLGVNGYGGNKQIKVWWVVSSQEVSMVCTLSSTTSRPRGVTAFVRTPVVPCLYL